MNINIKTKFIEGMNSMGKLYLIEGIPGVGKTTYAKKLRDKLTEQGKDVIMYEEGDSHPADMAWQAYLNKKEYDDFITECKNVWEKLKKPKDFTEIIELIEKQTRIENNQHILAYTRIGFPFDDYWKTVDSVADKEICDGRSSFEMFRDIHLVRWKNFADKASESDTVHIFECAFLQNHITELMGTYNLDRDFILDYFKKLIKTAEKLQPEIIYIKTDDIKKVIDLAAEERVGSYGKWIDRVAEWVSERPYGKVHNLSGIEGFYKYCQARYDMDLYVLERIKIPYTYINREV